MIGVFDPASFNKTLVWALHTKRFVINFLFSLHLLSHYFRYPSLGIRFRLLFSAITISLGPKPLPLFLLLQAFQVTLYALAVFLFPFFIKQTLPITQCVDRLDVAQCRALGAEPFTVNPNWILRTPAANHSFLNHATSLFSLSLFPTFRPYERLVTPFFPIALPSVSHLPFSLKEIIKKCDYHPLGMYFSEGAAREEKWCSSFFLNAHHGSVSTFSHIEALFSARLIQAQSNWVTSCPLLNSQ